MKRTLLLITLILSVHFLFAQRRSHSRKHSNDQNQNVNPYDSIDKKALQIPDSLTKTTAGIAKYIRYNFKTDDDKTRAIFIWIATNIQYDIDNMFAINFYEKREDKISKALLTRKGICENYAALFEDICNKSGIKSYVIEGYTKQNGFTDYIPHAWCTALVDTNWFMFDPTWGSGFVNNGKFYKKINNDYYKALPMFLISTHMPFDYLWQFLTFILTNQEFYDGKIQKGATKQYFNYKDSLKVYEKQNHIEQITASARRIEKNGVKNSMIFDRLQHIKMELENDRLTKINDLYNSAVNKYNDGINGMNEYIQYRNKMFKPIKTDDEIQNMLDSVAHNFNIAKRKLSEIKNPDNNITESMVRLNKSISDASIQLDEQQAWLKKYIAKKPSGRKAMFYQH